MPKTKTLRLALFKSEYNSVSAQKEHGWADEDDEYVRISEFTKVEFTILGKKEVTLGAIKQIDKQIRNTQAKAEKQITELTQRRNELLALEVLKDES